MIKKIRFEMLLYVDDERGVNLENPNVWSLVLLDERHDEHIYDIELNREGETSFRPKITILE